MQTLLRNVLGLFCSTVKIAGNWQPVFSLLCSSWTVWVQCVCTAGPESILAAGSLADWPVPEHGWQHTWPGFQRVWSPVCPGKPREGSCHLLHSQGLTQCHKQVANGSEIDPCCILDSFLPLGFVCMVMMFDLKSCKKRQTNFSLK